MTLQLLALALFHPVRTAALLATVVSGLAAAAIWAHVTAPPRTAP